MSRFIVIVLDGFGVGAMGDTEQLSPHDKSSNTALKLIVHYQTEKLPTLERLGLMNILGSTTIGMNFSHDSIFGRANLMHEGADTFMGHQEIMGSKPKPPTFCPFQQSIDKIKKNLIAENFAVEELQKNGLRALLVEKSVVIADNLEAELGQVYNLTANFNDISITVLNQIASIVRKSNKVGRNIAFGGYIGSTQQIIDALEIRRVNELPVFIGVNTPKTDVYNQGFQVRHLGYGVNFETQVPYLLKSVYISSYLYGKVADIVWNDGVSYKSIVDTETLFSLLIADLAKVKSGFFCLNVQETDLAGHQESPSKYWNVLEKADKGIANIIQAMNKEDCLIVMADHGNDPFIGHSKHTREQVPLMIYSPNFNANNLNIGTRASLSDVGASVCAYFNAPPPENGESFLVALQTCETRRKL